MTIMSHTLGGGAAGEINREQKGSKQQCNPETETI